MSLNVDAEAKEPETEATPPKTRRPRWQFSGSLFVVVILVVASAAVGSVVTWQLLRPAPAAPPGAVSVIDDAGRNVTMASTPHRIVVLGPNVMDILFRLGLRSAVVGVDCGTPSAGGMGADYTPGQIQNWSMTGLACITWLPTLNLQGIEALHPNLVIGGTGIKVTDLDTLTQSYGIPALYLNPSTLVGISYDVTIVGELTRTTSAAAHVDAQMAQTLTQVENLTSNAALVSTIPSLLLTYYDDPQGYWTFGPGTFGSDLVTLAGATSISANDTYANQGELSGSYVLAANPAIIVVGTGFGLTVSDYSIGPDWANLTAVHTGHVYGINAALITEPDPTMVFAVLTLLEIIHPGVPTS